jgi:hypothetical protein
MTVTANMVAAIEVELREHHNGELPILEGVSPAVSAK